MGRPIRQTAKAVDYEGDQLGSMVGLQKSKIRFSCVSFTKNHPNSMPLPKIVPFLPIPFPTNSVHVLSSSSHFDPTRLSATRSIDPHSPTFLLTRCENISEWCLFADSPRHDRARQSSGGDKMLLVATRTNRCNTSTP